MGIVKIERNDPEIVNKLYKHPLNRLIRSSFE